LAWDFPLVRRFASVHSFALRCRDKFKNDFGFAVVRKGVRSKGIEGIEGGVEFERIEQGICGDIGERIREGAIGGITGRGSTD